MKRRAGTAGALALAFATLVHAGSAEEAATAAADAFYRELIARRVDGLPDEAAMRVLRPMLSPDLVTMIEAARAERDEAMRQAPDEKPPFVEGNLFGSMYEGMSSFELGRALVHDGKASIPVYLEYRDDNGTSRWIDVVVLARDGAAWRVHDIAMNAPWDFRSGPDLRAMLRVTE